MTTRNESILVRGGRLPLPEPRIVFSPGVGATYDGDRLYASIGVEVAASDAASSRLSFERTALSDALDAVDDAAGRVEPATVVLDGRHRFRELYGTRGVDRIEAALERAAGAVDALLVVRTGRSSQIGNRDRYGAVIDLADGRTWRGAPADPPRPRYSRSRGTAPGRSTSDP